MIDISTLNKAVTYAGYEVGMGFISKKIQQFSIDEVIESKVNMKEEEIASHVFALIFDSNLNSWMIYESHLAHKGVKKFTLDAWLATKKKDLARKIAVFPFELSKGIVEYYEKHNPGYGSGDIANMTLEEVTKCGGLSWINCPGIICSEYLSLSDNEYKVCNIFGYPPHHIKPVHFQIYAIKQGISSISLI